MLSPAVASAVLLGALSLGLGALALERHRAVRASRSAARAFQDLYDHISEGVFRSTLDGRMISANPSLVRLNGFSSEAEMLQAVTDIAGEWYVEPGRRAELHRRLTETGVVTGFVSEVYRYKTRERIWIEESTRLVRDPESGAPLYYEGTVREVTETIRRLQLQEHYDKIASILSGCLYQHRLRPDGSSEMPYASIGLLHIFGVAPESVKDNAARLTSLIHPDDIPAIRASLRDSAERLSCWQCEYRVILGNGTEKWVFAHAVPEAEADGSVLFHGFITDISERKRAEATIRELAYFDPLTRLPNRAMLLGRLKCAISTSRASGRWGGLLFLDLDHFKTLNDTKGHHVGDLLLIEVARRVRTRVGAGDVVARLGGDEFVVLIEDAGAEAGEAAGALSLVSMGLMADIAEPYTLEGQAFSTTASIGVALFHGEEATIEEILKRADLAMYEAKAAGRGTIRFFRAEMQAEMDYRLALISDLRRELTEGRLTLAYQPQLDSAGRCLGAEALLRWNHPDRGPVAPAEFIPLAERYDLIDLIDGFVLKAACRTLREWRDDPLTAGLLLSINISARQLNRIGFVDMVATALAESGADASRLVLELTEHVMLGGIDEVVEVMTGLRALGVRFAIDDFGTGYCSLSYLKRLPIDTLKIDRSFVADIETDKSDRAIVQTIISIARNLDVAVIAEGVETRMQAMLLQQLGCRVFQGFLFAEPMPVDRFTAFLGGSASERIADVA